MQELKVGPCSGPNLLVEIIRIPNMNITIWSNYSDSIWIPNYSSHPGMTRLLLWMNSLNWKISILWQLNFPFQIFSSDFIQDFFKDTLLQLPSQACLPVIWSSSSLFLLYFLSLHPETRKWLVFGGREKVFSKFGSCTKITIFVGQKVRVRSEVPRSAVVEQIKIIVFTTLWCHPW